MMTKDNGDSHAQFFCAYILFFFPLFLLFILLDMWVGCGLVVGWLWVGCGFGCGYILKIAVFYQLYGCLVCRCCILYAFIVLQLIKKETDAVSAAPKSRYSSANALRMHSLMYPCLLGTVFSLSIISLSVLLLSFNWYLVVCTLSYLSCGVIFLSSAIDKHPFL